jgi:glycosyltransferase involved in cell wall biosynthesis
MSAVRVASVPASHVYVRHLSDPAARGVVRLPDPPPADGRTVPGGWWPPLMLVPDWVEDNHGRFDIFHIHFGFDSISCDDLARVIELLRRHGKPLVYTAHDLRNPHHRESAMHNEHLDLLVPAADAVITLTAGARDEIRRRWNTTAVVLPHPHVVPSERMGRPRPEHPGRFVIGVHAKSLRASMDPLTVASGLAREMERWPDAVLQVNVHDEIYQPDNYWYSPAIGADLLDLDRCPQVDVRVHPYFDDDQLWDYLSSLDVSVLPYRFGTHSGWLEACFDLGTGVAAPDCGYYGQQRPCGVFEFGEGRELGVRSLVEAIERFRKEPPRQPRWTERWRERRALAAAHAGLYARVLR